MPQVKKLPLREGPRPLPPVTSNQGYPSCVVTPLRRIPPLSPYRQLLPDEASVPQPQQQEPRRAPPPALEPAENLADDGGGGEGCWAAGEDSAWRLLDTGGSGRGVNAPSRQPAGRTKPQERSHHGRSPSREEQSVTPQYEYLYYDEVTLNANDMGPYFGDESRDNANSLFREYVSRNRQYDGDGDGGDDERRGQYSLSGGSLVAGKHDDATGHHHTRAIGNSDKDTKATDALRARVNGGEYSAKAGKSQSLNIDTLPAVLGGPRPELDEPLIPPKVATCCACGVLIAVIFLWVLFEYVRQQTEWRSPHVDAGNVEFFNEVFARRVAAIIRRAATESDSVLVGAGGGAGLADAFAQGGVAASWARLVGLSAGGTINFAGGRLAEGPVLRPADGARPLDENSLEEEGLAGWGAQAAAKAAAKLSSGPAPGEVEEWTHSRMAAQEWMEGMGTKPGSVNWALAHSRRYPLDSVLSPWGMVAGALGPDDVMEGGRRGVKAVEDYNNNNNNIVLGADAGAGTRVSKAALTHHPGMLRNPSSSASSAVSSSKVSKSSAASSSASPTRVGRLMPSKQTRKELCDLVPIVLFGNVSGDVNREHKTLTLAQVQAWHKDLAPGGEWSPPGCVARYRLAVVIPYRDRLAHLTVLLAHLIPILKRQQLHFRIFVVEQSGNLTFNKGRIMNAAFKEALKLYDFQCVAFHDVDLIPEDDRNMYSCPIMPRHMSVAVDEMNYTLSYTMLVGGVLNMRVEHFQQVNGYSNMYWGWGAEDDDMAYRILHVGLKIFRPPSRIARYQMIKHVKRKPTSWSIRGRLLRTAVKRYHLDGLNSVQYNIKFIHNDPLYTHIMVDVGKPDMLIDQR